MNTLRSSRSTAAFEAAHQAAVDDIVDLLCSARRALDESTTIGDVALLDIVAASTLPRWRQLLGVAASAARALSHDAESFDRCRRSARSRLQPLLFEGPIWSRSYLKPRGYPGDHAIMNFVFDGTDEGRDLYARLCHRLGLDVGDCVRTRLRPVIDELAQRMGAAGESLDVLSLGCGSSREIAAALDRGLPRRRVRFVLLDHDAEALECARGFIDPAAASLPVGSVEVQYVRLSYAELVNDAARLGQWSGQELVYCMGLLDYVPQKQVEPLIGALFGLVGPGGTLILGNMKDPSLTFWPLDFILDWPLIYRTDREMLELADRPGVRASRLWLEETGNNFVLELSKQ